MELLLAAKSGDLTHVKELLEEGVDINVTNSSGASALILAAEKNDTEMVHVLVKAGADLSL
jgi:ankyrin repeat protein